MDIDVNLYVISGKDERAHVFEDDKEDIAKTSDVGRRYTA